MRIISGWRADVIRFVRHGGLFVIAFIILFGLWLAGCGSAKFESVTKSKKTAPVVVVTPTPTPTPTPPPCGPIDDPGQSDDPAQSEGE